MKKVFPEFFKTNEKGYTTVIHLPDSVLSEKKIMELIKGMQYSRSNQRDRGVRIKDYIEFFSKDNSSDKVIPIAYSTRTYASIKVYEYFPENSGWHTEVDVNSHE
jgi:hypothetical protein